MNLSTIHSKNKQLARNFQIADPDCYRIGLNESPEVLRCCSGVQIEKIWRCTFIS